MSWALVSGNQPPGTHISIVETIVSTGHNLRVDACMHTQLQQVHNLWTAYDSVFDCQLQAQIQTHVVAGSCTACSIYTYCCSSAYALHNLSLCGFRTLSACPGEVLTMKVVCALAKYTDRCKVASTSTACIALGLVQSTASVSSQSKLYYCRVAFICARLYIIGVQELKFSVGAKLARWCASLRDIY